METYVIFLSKYIINQLLEINIPVLPFSSMIELS